MSHSSSPDQDRLRPYTSQTQPLTDYQIAVLSTLFDAEDCSKVVDLAREWGYQQEELCSAWNEIHASLFTTQTSIATNN